MCFRIYTWKRISRFIYAKVLVISSFSLKVYSLDTRGYLYARSCTRINSFPLRCFNKKKRNFFKDKNKLTVKLLWPRLLIIIKKRFRVNNDELSVIIPLSVTRVLDQKKKKKKKCGHHSWSNCSFSWNAFVAWKYSWGKV